MYLNEMLDEFPRVQFASHEKTLPFFWAKGNRMNHC